jgi:hypothetical protein
MKKRMVIFLSILVVLMLACNLARTGSTPQAPASATQESGNQPVESAQPAGTPPSSPVSINDGLGSLNSYLMTIAFKTIGPDPTQISTTTVEVKHSKDPESTQTHINMVAIPAGGGEPDTNESNIYSIGNDQCSGSGEDWEWTSYSADETEMTDLVKSMVSLTPLIENPTFVGEETVNGIPSNHFTFKVSGLGVKSGAEVRINQGDYWLAVDGQYIVKYLLIIEESTDPAKVLHSEISIDLTQINQPVDIAFPQGCLDASLVTPEP